MLWLDSLVDKLCKTLIFNTVSKPTCIFYWVLKLNVDIIYVSSGDLVRHFSCSNVPLTYIFLCYALFVIIFEIAKSHSVYEHVASIRPEYFIIISHRFHILAYQCGELLSLEKKFRNIYFLNSLVWPYCVEHYYNETNYRFDESEWCCIPANMSYAIYVCPRN